MGEIVSVESADKGWAKALDTGQFNFRDRSPLRIRSSLTIWFQSLGRSFPLRCQKFFVPRYRLCQHPLSCRSKLPFSSILKDIEGFKHELNSLNIVTTATSVTK